MDTQRSQHNFFSWRFSCWSVGICYCASRRSGRVPLYRTAEVQLSCTGCCDCGSCSWKNCDWTSSMTWTRQIASKCVTFRGINGDRRAGVGKNAPISEVFNGTFRLTVIGARSSCSCCCVFAFALVSCSRCDSDWSSCHRSLTCINTQPRCLIFFILERTQEKQIEQKSSTRQRQVQLDGQTDKSMNGYEMFFIFLRKSYWDGFVFPLISEWSYWFTAFF